jgi:S-adenosylmethionine synthetase
MTKVPVVHSSRIPSNGNSYTFTSESVTEGHPDKVCDYIADSILDEHIRLDAKSHVACEVLCKEGNIIIAGEISSNGRVDHEKVARNAVCEIGYTDTSEKFNAHTTRVQSLLSEQSREIDQGVSRDVKEEQGAGDQGIMFGYATDETPELMPLPILLAHSLARGLAADRRSGNWPWLRPDGKTQVSVVYAGNTPVAVSDVLVSTQHTSEVKREEILAYVSGTLAPRILGNWYSPEIRFLANPTGSFVLGGPSADCGVTGRKIIVDSYGGTGRHGGGAFSGKDPSKVDRSGAYFCRFIARQLVKSGIAKKAEIQVSYAIGVAQPVSVKVDTFSTGDDRAAAEFVKKFDFRPAAIIERLNLLQPIYRKTTNYGHFGKAGLPWEE